MLELIYRPLFSKAEIVRLGAFVKTFDPNDEYFFDSETQCPFNPISNDVLQTWNISAADAAEMQSSLDISKLDLILEGWFARTIISATMHAFQIIMAQFKLHRQDKVYMADTFRWGPVE